jgi:outer membrane protein, multidrug efflux system
MSKNRSRIFRHKDTEYTKKKYFISFFVYFVSLCRKIRDGFNWIRTYEYLGSILSPGSWVLALVFPLLLVSSCIFRPDYTRPYVNVPESWRLPTEEACSYANIRWWDQLGDPVLDTLILEALQYNNDLQVAIASVDQYYGIFRTVYSQLFPQINGSGVALRQQLSRQLSPGIPETFLLQDNFIALLSCTYELDVWGRLYAASDAALAQYLAQIQARRTVVLTLVSEVANAYIILRQYDEQLKVARETLKSFRESQVLMTERFLAGAVSQLPVEQARSETDAAAIQVKELEISVEQQENLLSVLLGRNPGDIKRGKLLEELTQPPCVPAGIPSDILEQRPDVMQAELNLVSAHSNVGVAKANFFPQISLTGFYGNESLDLSQLIRGSATTWQFGASAFQPIFNGGFYVGQLEIATAVEQEALFAYYSTILTAFKEVDDALIAHKKSLELLTVQKDQVAAYSKYLYLAQLEYDNGQVDYLNVLDAQRNLFSSELNLKQAESFTFTTLINLYKALGGGWVLEADTITIEGGDVINHFENYRP